MERSADWMDQARGDLEHARQDMQTGYYEWACFSAQQSAEKALKAVFQKLGGDAWGHSVSDLLDLLRESPTASEFDITDTLVDAALELDKAYIATRYPDAHPSGSPGQRYTKTEAERLIGHAERILKFCERTLSAL